MRYPNFEIFKFYVLKNKNLLFFHVIKKTYINIKI